MRREHCHRRINQVVLSYRTVLQTVEVLIQLAKSDPKYLHVNKLELSALQALTGELHDVYFVRVFACFESDLRHYWRTSVRDTKPPTEQLLSSIAARCGIPQNKINAVHDVRVFRNFLIHEEHEIRERLTIDDALKALNGYLAWLPLEW
jgi:hypothetical protein